MKTEHDRAFKEWAISCQAMQSGEQILLIRKGGIREKGGAFTIADKAFFLMPTYEHQNAELLRPEWMLRLHAIQAEAHDPDAVTISAYAEVDTILQARDEAQVNAAGAYHIWNPTYTKQRFDFNPYDPLYLLVLRVYNLARPETLPMQAAYVGCKSWVTLERPLSLHGAMPALPDDVWEQRRQALLASLA
jgi:hypothetical protein